MRKLLFAIAAISAIAVTTPASAKPDSRDRDYRHSDSSRGDYDRDHDRHRGDYDRDRHSGYDRDDRRFCPPGLAKKNRRCMPPGQYKKRGDRYSGGYGRVPSRYGSRYRDNDRYFHRYDDRGRIYVVDRRTGNILRVINVRR